MSTVSAWAEGFPRALLRHFDLRQDQASVEHIDASLRAGASFQGTNLWLLIFAILIASIGLNVNSAAVIIGAMLISPLMGPIMALGYGAAMNDIALIRLAARSLAIAVLLSLLASALYFGVTPLSAARSEILARTSPAIWDVLIALFGGLAGMIGVTRQEKSNVVPGVAIATALMPPLCTAGYGLATGQLRFFLGAFYLFSINSVFIATATLIMARVMRLPARVTLNADVSGRARWTIALIVLLAGLPSVYLAARLVQDEVFLTRAESFISASFPPERGTYVVARSLDPKKGVLRLTVVGEPLSVDRQVALEQSLPVYGLPDAQLEVVQNRQQEIDLQSLRQNLASDLVGGTMSMLEQKSARIEELEAQRAERAATDLLLAEIGAELRASQPGVVEITVADGVRWVGEQRTGVLAVTLTLSRPLPEEERARLEAWLKLRSKREEITLVVQEPATAAP